MVLCTFVNKSLCGHTFFVLFTIYLAGELLEFCTEKAMETHSSILAWKIPWVEEPGRLQSMGW